MNIVARCVTCLRKTEMDVREFIKAVDHSRIIAEISGKDIVIQCDICVGERREEVAA